jgi:hypothetical protein
MSPHLHYFDNDKEFFEVMEPLYSLRDIHLDYVIELMQGPNHSIDGSIDYISMGTIYAPSQPRPSLVLDQDSLESIPNPNSIDISPT